MIQRMEKRGAEAVRWTPVRVVQRFLGDRGPNYAVLIAWNLLFSLFPIVLALAAIGGAILAHAGVSETQIELTIIRLIPSGVGGASMAAAVHGVERHSGLLGIIAIIGFLWSASGLFGTLEYVCAQVFRISTRGFIQQKVMALVMMLIFVILAGAGVSSSAIFAFLANLPFGSELVGSHGAPSLALQVPIGLVSGFVLFYLIYTIVPNARIHPLHALPGAAFAAIAFEVLVQLFPLYLHFDKGVNQYGSTFAALFVILTFFYFLGLIMVLGLEINATLHEPSVSAAADAPEHAEPARRRAPRWLLGLGGAVLGLVLAGRSRRLPTGR
ncbi:MAG TPA: YihY/virulence factor BrkB family protein [Candidatus Dormibacteraeota bacterium]|nr:YihY/virulence factor BrkB family protein [Candidatus Dormibacteraeota bacterium]